MEGVSISLVRTISRGARKTPAIPIADTATNKELSGEGEEMMSIPPAAAGLPVKLYCDIPGSGKAKSAARKDRMKDVKVDRSREWT